MSSIGLDFSCIRIQGNLQGQDREPLGEKPDGDRSPSSSHPNALTPKGGVESVSSCPLDWVEPKKGGPEHIKIVGVGGVISVRLLLLKVSP